MITEKDIRLFIEGSQKLLILCHDGADPDAVGSALAIKMHYGDKNISIACDGVSKTAKFLLKYLGEEIDEPPKIPDAILVVDTSSLELLGKYKDTVMSSDNVAIIDHHATSNFSNVNMKVIYRKLRNSTAELVWEILDKPKDKRVRKALLAGVLTDTAHLRHADGQTFKALHEMVADDINFEEIFAMLKDDSGHSQKVALIKALQRMRVWKVGDYIVVRTFIGSFESFIARNILNIGVDVVIIINERKGNRIVARATRRAIEKGVDLSKIMYAVGEDNEGNGGGHPPAAGIRGLKDIRKAADEIVNRVLDSLGSD
ncbi:MAG: DHH family phosphoesterase [Candidatus Methanofastidiosia archaeon]